MNHAKRSWRYLEDGRDAPVTTCLVILLGFGSGIGFVCLLCLGAMQLWDGVLWPALEYALQLPRA